VKNRDRETIYSSKYSLAEAEELSPELGWEIFLEAGGFGKPERFVIAQKEYFQAIGKIFRNFSVEDWQSYFRFRLLQAYAPYLNNEFVEENFDFNKRILRGQVKPKERWKRGVRLINTTVGELMGAMYVEKFFPESSKERMLELVENLRHAFHGSIDSLTWMSEPTKIAAQKKLAAFNSKIGYPDVWKDYSQLVVDADDLVGNVIRSKVVEHNREVEKLSKPVDRTEWGMNPQTVNAYYRSTLNEIVFPAAILQPPFFDTHADDAHNYGAIGSVIGHEFSHGFDDQGRKFDGQGRLRDWWTSEDAEKFQHQAAGLIAQYNAFEPLPGININGELTLGENIADLAGLIVAYRAYKISLQGMEAPVIDGFTGDQRFFIGYALSSRGKYRAEYLRETLIRDPHSPSEYRVMGILPNIDYFYDVFGVSKDDAMFIPPEERVNIW
jgi:putative endopeptidase